MSLRPDQVIRLQELAERLADVFINEAEPSEWPGEGKPVADMDKDERGDRYWCKRNAIATANVLQNTLTIIKGKDVSDPDALDALDQHVSDAEMRAERAAKAALGRFRHGKAAKSH
jgi:hypothetical protein